MDFRSRFGWRDRPSHFYEEAQSPTELEDILRDYGGALAWLRLDHIDSDWIRTDMISIFYF